MTVAVSVKVGTEECRGTLFGGGAATGLGRCSGLADGLSSVCHNSDWREDTIQSLTAPLLGSSGETEHQPEEQSVKAEPKVSHLK